MTMIGIVPLHPRPRTIDPRDAEIARLKERIEELEVMLGFDDVKPFMVAGLKRREAQGLGLLLKREFVSHDTLREALSDTSTSSSYHTTYICRIRKALGPNLRDLVQVVWGTGVFIAAKDKPRIRKWIEAQARERAR